MPLSRQQFSDLLTSCTDLEERFLVLLIRDVEGEDVRLASLNTSDIDQISRLVRIRSPTGNGATKPVKLGTDTVDAYRDYMESRKDRDPFLFSKPSGGRMDEAEIRSWARMLGSRSGISFDEYRLVFQRRTPASYDQGRLVQKGANKDLFYLYGVVSHPIRRQIVELLGDEGSLGFTQIKNRLNVRVGTLYYHFDMLSGLITQDAQKKYSLTPAGREAYEKLHSREYVRADQTISESLPTSPEPSTKLHRFLTLAWLVTILQNQLLLALTLTGIVLIVGTFLVSQAGLETVILFLNPSPEMPVILGIEFIGNWLGIYAISDLMATYLFKRKGEHLQLLLGSAYALVPLILFAGWWTLVSDFLITLPEVGTFAFSRVVLIVFQGGSLLVLARMISRLKGLRLDKAAVICLTIAYLSVLIAYFQAG